MGMRGLRGGEMSGLGPLMILVASMPTYKWCRFFSHTNRLTNQ